MKGAGFVPQKFPLVKSNQTNLLVANCIYLIGTDDPEISWYQIYTKLEGEGSIDFLNTVG